MTDLNSRAVLVTGGSSGLGAAVVDAVTKTGGQPYVIDRQPPADGVLWVECDLADAKEVRDAVVSIMEACLARYCPTVPCIADGDIQLSLDDKTIVTDEQVDEMISQLALAA